METKENKAAAITKAIVAQLLDNLPMALTNSSDGGQVVIHVAPYCASAKIEYKLMVQVKPDAQRS